jgi:hypothetical protein
MKFWLFCLIPCFICWAFPPPQGRSPSTPFISGDTFRFHADHVFDELDTSLKGEAVKRGETVFVKTDYLGEFFRSVHPDIGEPYVLISHNSDDGAPGSYASYLDDDRLIAWFAQNYDGTPHPKMNPIPIGLANFHWEHGNFKILEAIRAKKSKKKHLLYLNIAAATFLEERKKVVDLLSKKSFCHYRLGRPYKRFLSEVAQSSFVASPRGNGLDTHRLWESLYLGSIPIVKTSSLDCLYEGLPVLIVSDWGEVTEDKLKDVKRQFETKSWDLDKLYIDYWVNQIGAVKAQALR